MKIGKVSESVLKRSVLKRIKTKRSEVINGAGVGEDCAIFALSQGEAMACCAQEAQASDLADVDSVKRAAVRCANNLAAAGAEPIAIMLTLLLPPETEEQQIRAFMDAAEAACALLRMQIAGGHTTVSGGVSRPIITVTGYGKVKREQARTARTARPGQDIVLSKWVGLEGTAMLARIRREGLLSRYPGYLVEEASDFDKYLSVAPEAAVALKSGVCAMHDASLGGIFAALWELAEGAGAGLTIDLKKLPIRQETVEVCEYCNVNPYELLSGGCLLMTTDDGPGLAAALVSAGIPAAVAGRITDSKDRIVVNEEEIRYLERPRTDEIYRFL